MQTEVHPRGVILDRPAIVLRGAGFIGGMARAEATSPAAEDTRGTELFETADRLALSPEGRRLASLGEEEDREKPSKKKSVKGDEAGAALSTSLEGGEPADGDPVINEEDREKPSRKAARKKTGDEATTALAGEELSEQDQQKLREMKARDAEVKAHEQAHLAAAGGQALGGANFEYEKGPDGNRYAVAGDVKIRFGGDSPEQRLREAETAQRAATAPANPSPADRRVASEAAQAAAEARQEIAEQRRNGDGVATLSEEEDREKPSRKNVTGDSTTSAFSTTVDDGSDPVTTDETDREKPSRKNVTGDSTTSAFSTAVDDGTDPVTTDETDREKPSRKNVTGDSTTSAFSTAVDDGTDPVTTDEADREKPSRKNVTGDSTTSAFSTTVDDGTDPVTTDEADREKPSRKNVTGDSTTASSLSGAYASAAGAYASTSVLTGSSLGTSYTLEAVA